MTQQSQFQVLLYIKDMVGRKLSEFGFDYSPNENQICYFLEAKNRDKSQALAKCLLKNLRNFHLNMCQITLRLLTMIF